MLATLAAEAGIPLAVVTDPIAAPPSAAVTGASQGLVRPRRPVGGNELEGIVDHLRQRLRVDELVLAPTSEYLQDRAHAYEAGNRNGPLILVSTSSVEYRTLSSKIFLEHFQLAGRPLPTPTRLEGTMDERPFVAKPRFNIEADLAPKPFVVRSDEQWVSFVEQSDIYFAQALVPGPSVYWCGYRNADGTLVQYVQLNLLQVPGGGAIALARHSPASAFPRISELMVHFTAQIDYTGPIMAEFRGPNARLIEINPRFWGPLLLDAMNDRAVVGAFFRQYFGVESLTSNSIHPSTIYAVPSLVGQAVPVSEVFDDPVPGRPSKAMSSDEAIRMTGWDPSILGGAW